VALRPRVPHPWARALLLDIRGKFLVYTKFTFTIHPLKSMNMIMRHYGLLEKIQSAIEYRLEQTVMCVHLRRCFVC
jgi:hypothetical protein